MRDPGTDADPALGPYPHGHLLAVRGPAVARQRGRGLVVILAPELGAQPAAPGWVARNVPGWLRQFPFPGGPQLVIVLTGEADVATSAQLRDQLGAAVDQASERLVIDVADVAFLDLSGLDVLYEAAREALLLGVTVTVRGLSPALGWVQALLRGQPVPVR